MDQKPTKIWAIFIIVLAVGLYYILYQGLYQMIAWGELGIFMIIGPMILGVLTLLIAFMVFNGNGKTILTILMVLAILGNLVVLMALFGFQSLIKEYLGESLNLTFEYVITAVQLILAIVVFMLLQDKEVKQYFKE